MTIWRPDPTFYPSPRTAMHAPPEKLAYMVVLNLDGGIAVDPDFFIEFSADERPHQIRLEGGESSSNSYCYPSS